MSLITLFSQTPELLTPKSTTADVLDAAKVHADYESSAPTGVALPSLSDIQAWEQLLIGIRTETGQIVTPEKAKRCATVLAIMRGLSEDVSALSLPLYKRGDQEDVIRYEHPTYQMLNVAPNAYQTPIEVREHLMFDLMLWGQFFNLKNLDGDITADTFGQATSLWPLQAAYVTRRWRELVWTFTDPTTGLSGTFTPDMVWRGTILSGNNIDGTAITLLAREAIGLLLAAEEQGARLFSHGIQTDFVLEMPEGESMDEDQKKQLRGAIMARHAGSENAFMPMLLEGGMKATKLGLTAQESQYIEARKFQIEDVARVFRYPEVLLGSSTSGKSSTYASAEQFFDSYTKHTLGPWTTRIEQTVHRDLLTQTERKKLYCKHDFSSLLKANETARIANWNAKIQGGWAQPAEARRDFNMPWKDGLDYFTRPAGSTGVAGKPAPQAPDPTQTDQSARFPDMGPREAFFPQAEPLIRRVAVHLLDREKKALVANKQDADSFYTNFGAYIEGLTGADGAQVRTYLETRRNLPSSDRFSEDHSRAALTALTSLCER